MYLINKDCEIIKVINKLWVITDILFFVTVKTIVFPGFYKVGFSTAKRR